MKQSPRELLRKFSQRTARCRESEGFCTCDRRVLQPGLVKAPCSQRCAGPGSLTVAPREFLGRLGIAHAHQLITDALTNSGYRVRSVLHSEGDPPLWVAVLGLATGLVPMVNLNPRHLEDG